MRPITASDLMNPNVLVVRDDLPVKDLAAFLMDNEITGAPVKDRHGKLVGVVSVVDIARAASEEETEEDVPAFFLRPEHHGLRLQELEALDDSKVKTVVADIMTPEVFTVGEDATVSEIASLMLDHHLHRVVVTRDDQPVGIISASDLLGLLIDEDDD